jgi:ATP-dependent Clp protease protease subunit
MVEMKEIETHLLNRRVIALSEIDEREAQRVLLNLIRLQLESSDPAYLVIDSPGGMLYPAMGLHDAIEHAFTMEVHAIVHGECKSAATFVLLACKQRLAMPHSQFLIHSGMMSNITLKTDALTAEKLNQLLAEIERDTRMVTALYEKKLGKSPDEIKRLIARGDQQFNGSFTAQEALEIGLVTEIISGKLPFFPLPTPPRVV